jgi:hypothetical protein
MDEDRIHEILSGDPGLVKPGEHTQAQLEARRRRLAHELNRTATALEKAIRGLRSTERIEGLKVELGRLRTDIQRIDQQLKER